MIALIDYDAGNIRSVGNALDRLGADWRLSADPDVIRAASKVILPGVGSAAAAVESLRQKGLDRLIPSLRKPVLGICVGLQILCKRSEEGDAEGLGLFDCTVRRFPESAEAKVPHMGWNAIRNLQGRLFKETAEGTFMYFVHSYYAGLCTDTIATCRHGDVLFSAALKYENFYGVQFHPEKSGDAGEALLGRFLAL